MKKKAGIVLGATVAGLLAMSPLAFASDGWGGGDGVDKDSTSLVGGANGNNGQVPLQGCNNDGNVLGGQLENADLTGLGGSATDNSDKCGQAGGAGDAGN